MRPDGELAIVLHTHMPYVEGGGSWPPPDPASYLRDPQGFGTWPFGEEWLWEAIATSYIPLLDVLGSAPITLSLTPVLCDQLEAPGALDRCLGFLTDVRRESHGRDIEHFREDGNDLIAAELERSARDYSVPADRLRGMGDAGLLAELGRHARWTSAATHALLPMLASDPVVALQIQTGIASHRRRFGEWRGGFWLPECGHAPWIDELLEEAGVRSTCVELTALFGLGDARHLRPLATEAGAVLWPVDRAAMSLVWSEDGYPSAGPYRDHHRLTPHHHRAWRNDGQVYHVADARALASAHARDFVARVRDRVRGGGVCVCALDTELLGHWWYEGVEWLGAVVQEAGHQGLRLTELDNALERHEPVPAPAALGVSTWGAGGDLRTWSAPQVADLAWLARSAEMRALAIEAPSERALRELLALQASDWAFLATRRLAGEYPRERAHAHAEAFEAALADPDAASPRLRNLAPDLVAWGA
jgi:1,4-alpha-glucan branching enzyme